MTHVQSLGDQIVAAACECLGTRFRPKGRQPGLGLDCVGLAVHAFCAVGMPVSLPSGYAMRGGDQRDIERWIHASGLRCAPESEVRKGDLLLLRPGHRQFHFAIRSHDGFIHADIGLRRIVETPGGPPWPILSVWRCSQHVSDREG